MLAPRWRKFTKRFNPGIPVVRENRRPRFSPKEFPGSFPVGERPAFGTEAGKGGPQEVWRGFLGGPLFSGAILPAGKVCPRGFKRPLSGLFPSLWVPEREPELPPRVAKFSGPNLGFPLREENPSRGGGAPFGGPISRGVPSRALFGSRPIGGGKRGGN